MFNNKERKEERLRATEGNIISASQYNIAIGGITIYGLVMNAILAYTATTFMSKVNPVAFLLIYIACAFAGAYIAHRSKSPLMSFVGYNLIAVPIGLLLSLILPFEDPGVIASAFLATAVVTALMIVMAIMMPHIFEKMGPVLFVALFAGVIVELIASLLGYGGDIFNWFFVTIFSLYIGYDWYRAQQYPKTLDNAVDCALDLYLDIINLFLRLLEIFGSSKRK